MRTATVQAKCISCGATRDIRAGEVPADEMPQCHQCGDLMIAVRATVKGA